MKKKIMALVGGVVVGFIMVIVFEYINHLIFPPPADMDPMDIESVKAFMKEIPVGALIGIWFGWMISAFIAGFVSGKIDKINWKNNGYIIATVLLVASIVNMYLIPHPIWMVVITIIGYLPFTLAGSTLAVK